MSREVFVIVFLVVPLLVLWGIVLSDILIRKDLRVWKKLGWAAFTLLLAEIGALVYVVLRPVAYPEEDVDASAEGSSSTREFLTTATDHVEGRLSDDAWSERSLQLLG